jgi:hypothetical protein
MTTTTTSHQEQSMTTPAPIHAWHFSRFDGTHARQAYDRTPIIQPGGTERITATPILCERGLHGAERPLDALRYAKGPLVRWCAFGGIVVQDVDKLAAQTRTELWRADATRTLREFAIWCGERALTREREAGREPHADSWAALEAARRYLAGAIDIDALRLARQAAWNARYAAAAYAAYAAYAAADDAHKRVRDEQNAKLTEMLIALRPALTPTDGRATS